MQPMHGKRQEDWLIVMPSNIQQLSFSMAYGVENIVWHIIPRGVELRSIQNKYCFTVIYIFLLLLTCSYEAGILENPKVSIGSLSSINVSILAKHFSELCIFNTF